MIGYIVKKLIGSKNDREVKKLRPLVAKINEFEAALQSKPDEYLREKTAEWKARCGAITDQEELRVTLDEILPEAFAVVKSACRRLCGTSLRHRCSSHRFRTLLARRSTGSPRPLG